MVTVKNSHQLISLVKMSQSAPYIAAFTQSEHQLMPLYLYCRLANNN